MGTAITWLIAFFIVITTAFAAINSVITSASNRAEAQADSNALLIAELESSISIVSVKQGGGHTRIELVVTNDGRTTLGDFENWDITVRYTQDGADETILMPPYVDTLVDNTWVTQRFWLDYKIQAELIEPGLLNPHEELEIRIQVNPKLNHGTYFVVTVTTPFGVTRSINLEA